MGDGRQYGASGFDAIVKAARDAKLPLVINDPEFVQRGALVAVGIGWYETGKAASKVLARVLRGEQPRNIPFEDVAVKKLVLNQEVAKALGITFPPDMVQAASQSSQAVALFVSQILGIAFGAGLYEHRIVTSGWLSDDGLRWVKHAAVHSVA